jgi:hypothetical protein
MIDCRLSLVLFLLRMGCGASSDAPHKPAAKAEEPHVDWDALKKRMPPLDKSEESKEARLKLFKRMDVNSNGYLSLAELDKASASIFIRFHGAASCLTHKQLKCLS